MASPGWVLFLVILEKAETWMISGRCPSQKWSSTVDHSSLRRPRSRWSSTRSDVHLFPRSSDLSRIFPLCQLLLNNPWAFFIWGGVLGTYSTNQEMTRQQCPNILIHLSVSVTKTQNPVEWVMFLHIFQLYLFAQKPFMLHLNAWKDVWNGKPTRKSYCDKLYVWPLDSLQKALYGLPCDLQMLFLAPQSLTRAGLCLAAQYLGNYDTVGPCWPLMSAELFGSWP